VIERLHVRDLAVIEDVELELGPGLHVLSGETGAGKSILLTALALLSGKRVGAESVRAGAPEARVEALLAQPEVAARARALGFGEAQGSPDEVLLVRTLAREGKSRAFINGGLATLRLLEEVLGDALEITTQGEHHRLLRSEVQTELLDAFGGHAALLERVAEAHGRVVALFGELRGRAERASEWARREDHLRFEIEQIEGAELRPGELAELETEHARLSHLDRLADASSAALALLEGDEGAGTRVGQARSRLRSAITLDPRLGDADAALERAGLELDEARLLLARYQTELEPDPARLEQVEARLAELRRLDTRYGPGEVAILEHLERARVELSSISGGELRLRELEVELGEAERALAQASLALCKSRRHAAEELGSTVERELGALGLARARFEARIEPIATKLEGGREIPSGPRGSERVVFWLAPNPGEPARPLRDAASGGERARLLLAIKSALRDADAPRTLLFDEVDAGIGGRAARQVGERLASLAGRHQLLVVTHLPQIAGLADAHYRVVKQVRGRRTRTRVERVEGEARVEEIARMAGGSPTEAARAHARELLRR
jgi:DNA repair protein RecN (Recombination protein N)